MGQQDASATPAPSGESAPAFPPQRDPETPAPRPAQVPGPRPGAEAAPEARSRDAERPENEPEPEPESEPDIGAEPDVGAELVQASAPAAAETGLGARERAVLDFERRRWKHAGAKEQAIRDTFELSATRYYQILNALLDEPAALAYAPALVARLRRIRDSRRRARH